LQKTASGNVLVRHDFLRTGASLLSYLVAIICAWPRIGKERIGDTTMHRDASSRRRPDVFLFSQDRAARPEPHEALSISMSFGSRAAYVSDAIAVRIVRGLINEPVQSEPPLNRLTTLGNWLLPS
jgi:hypothetical protein